jgi:hypothetical protein
VLKLPEARITHSTSRRLRIKIPSKKGNTKYFVSLQRKFSECDRVQTVKANALTASVLFFHDCDTRNISKFGEEKCLFRIEKQGTKRTVLTKRIRNSFQDLNTRTKSLTGGELDLPSVAFVSLLSMSIYQIIRGNFYAPAWYTCSWYAVNLAFRSSDNKDTNDIEEE